VNARCLVVQARLNPQLNGSATDRELERQQVAAIELLGVRADRIDLTTFVTAMDQTVSSAAATPGSNHDHATLLDGPLALDSEQPWPKVEDEVIPLVIEGKRNAQTELECERADLRLRKRPFLVRRQHGQHPTRAIGRTAAQVGDRFA
jgi:hypothetical protein